MTFWSRARRFLFGTPIKTTHAHHERLPKALALPVFASDALSSVAYATEEVLRVLVLGIAAASYTAQSADRVLIALKPISIGIALLLVVVAISYIQTIFAYPKGGGSYIVSSENLGSIFGRIAGGSLLIDYTLTVAVSVSAGVAAIVSAFHPLGPYAMPLAIFFVALITLANLRGVKESGALFALPTYSFILGMGLVLGACFVKFTLMGETPHAAHALPMEEILPKLGESLTLFFFLRAFSAGCTALTGIEAIADGVGAFKSPESKNAAQTLFVMAAILVTMFLGVSYYSHQLHILPIPEESHAYQTVVSQIARSAFGVNWLYYFFQVATMAVLVLAANTAFADFPRLSYFMARDGFLPRQLMNIGDRLVFQNGIITLSLVAMILIVWSGADTHKLIPLYATGVFISFTMSQGGMVAWQIRHRRKWWPARAALNLAGALTTGVVAMVIFSTKFGDGAYIVGILLAALLVAFWFIHQHYNSHRGQLVPPEPDAALPQTVNTVLVLVPRVHRGVLRALQYAKSIGSDCRAVHVNIDPTESPRIRAEWDAYGQGLPLVILESPYRSILEPILEYVDVALTEHPEHMVTVIVPEFVPRRWWQRLLHNNLAFQLRRVLGGRRNIVISSVRYFLEK